MKPCVLIFHTLDFPNAARLAMACHAADFRVEVLCQAKHPVRFVRTVDRLHALNLFTPLNSLRRAVFQSQAKLIIPCDDMAVVNLHRLHEQELWWNDGRATPVSALIERSLGNPAFYESISTRSRLGEIAEAADVLMPQTGILRTIEDLWQWTERHGFPAVLKTDHSWGGEGVVVARDLVQAEAAFVRMLRRPPLLNLTKRIVIDSDPSLAVRRFFHKLPAITIQQFIPGEAANSATSCWQGQLLSCINVETVMQSGRTGMSTVVKVVEHPQMRETAGRVIRHLGMSGCCGFDFMIENGTNRAYLIEINPRATQINHLVLGEGRDIPGTLRAVISGEPARRPIPMTDRDTIAIFPQELNRDPKSPWLRSAYHDVPNDEPELASAMIRCRPRRPILLKVPILAKH